MYMSIATKNGRLTSGSQKSYKSYLTKIDKLNGNKTTEWISNAVNSKSNTPVLDILKVFDSAINTPDSAKLRAAFKDFATVIIGIYKAKVWAFSDKNIEFDLCSVIARTAIFASVEVVNKVKKGLIGGENNIGKGNKWASWDNMTHLRMNGKKGIVNGYIADSNNIANYAIKRAVILSYDLDMGNYRQFMDYEVCHIWDEPANPECYASIANLVLVPRAFGQLTDHCEAVTNLLRYEAFKRFDYLPTGKGKPAKPKFYNKLAWRDF